MSSTRPLGLTQSMVYTLRKAYTRDDGSMIIPPYCNANSVAALQRRGLADGWRLTVLGMCILSDLKRQQ